MEPLTESTIRASLVNCTRGEATRLALPRDLVEQPWEHLDYLGWRDPRAPARGCLVAPTEHGPVGIVLRAGSAAGAAGRRNLCSLCLTAHTGGVNLMVAPRAGRRGSDGNSVGTYICADLACSLYVRGRRRPAVVGLPETLGVEQRVARLQENLASFVRRVTEAA
ncbi:FBP domain-containing protein [Nocardioides sp.]|uniref:FBP domain-containing protein n=1 Tax=Nocardioides sp. TaxID=35761 RepID=UPI00351844B3